MIRPDKGQFPITQGFGDNKNQLGYGPLGHDGIDIGTPVGTTLYAARSGRIRDVNSNPTYGLRVKLDNGTNIDYVGHLSEALVHIGDQVKEGDPLAYSGATGNITGPHTHWGVYEYNGVALNPEIELEKVNKEEPMATLGDENNLNDLCVGMMGVELKDRPAARGLIGVDIDTCIRTIFSYPEAKAFRDRASSDPSEAQKKLDEIKGIVG